MFKKLIFTLLLVAVNGYGASLVVPVTSPTDVTNIFLSLIGTYTNNSGTVTSVTLAVPVDFAISNPTITTNGTITVTENTQTTNVFKAGPASGASAVPTYRRIEADDISTNIISVDKLSATGTRDSTTFYRGDGVFGVPPVGTNSTTFANPASYVELTATNGTSTNALRADVTLALNQGIAPQMTNTWTFRNTTNPVSFQYNSTSKVDLAISSGGTPTWTATSATNKFNGVVDAGAGFLVNGAAVSQTFLRGNGVKYIPAVLDGADITAGTINTARMGSGVANSSTFLRGDNTWDTPPGGGTVTSVALSAPTGEFDTVVGSPVTTSGTLQLNWLTQATNSIFAGPTNSAELYTLPRFRRMHTNDVPDSFLVATLKLTATGTKNTNTFLRGDDTWATPSGAGNVVSTGASTTNTIPVYSDTSGTAVTPKTLVAGSNVTITQGATNITIAAASGGSISGGANVIAKFDSTGTNLSNSLIEDNTTSMAVQPRTNNVTTLGTGVLRFANVYGINMTYSGQLSSSVGSGTPPMVIASSTEVANLNVQKLGGHTSDYYNPYFVLGDTQQSDSSGNPVRLIGQGTTNIAFYAQKGTGNAYPNHSGAPFWSTLTAGTNITFTYTSTNVIINSSASGGSGDGGGNLQSTGSSTTNSIAVYTDGSNTNVAPKFLVAGSNITITQGATNLTFTAANTGETNTASNVGAGAGVFKQKTGVDLEFKTIIGSGITVTANTSDVTLTAAPTQDQLPTGVQVVIMTASPVDFKATGATTIFTPTAGRKFRPEYVIFLAASISGVDGSTTDPTISIGNNSATYDNIITSETPIMWGGAAPAVANDQTKRVNLTATGPWFDTFQNAGGAIKVNVTTAATLCTTATFYVGVVGYYL